MRDAGFAFVSGSRADWEGAGTMPPQSVFDAFCDDLLATEKLLRVLREARERYLTWRELISAESLNPGPPQDAPRT
jgi:hypothetical protein